MSSVIEGYNYDIFISYRQKDNKGDKWVSEFVEALKTELESTFKEAISVYFDINPHDGLLETHDVDDSLKEKLKCLIFIPIISRTYCDPRSFAWKHEFRAFVEEASKDQFGLKVKLPNGNVASRVLPVRIHDLDNDDIKLCESILGGVLRGIEFIYKESGIDKPLTADDDEKKNLNNTKYRIQIVKVAHAIREIISGIEHGQKPEVVSKEVVTIKPEKAKKRIPKTIAASVIIFALIVLFYFLIPTLSKPKKQLEKSIAVLPFKLLSNESDKQYLADGMMDAITLHLSKIKDLRVLGRTSTEQFRNPTKTLAKIGDELGVTYMLEGSFQKFGDNVRLIVQLIKVGKEGHVWANDYDRNWRDIFKVQSEVAQTIAKELHSVITPEEKRLIEKKPTNDLTAYDFYQRGREEHSKYWLDNTNKASLDKAEYLYHKALGNDSTFAKAYAGLARVYLDKHYWKDFFSESFLDSVLILSKIALSYDNELAEAYNCKGDYFREMGNPDQALKDLDKAIQFDPNNWMAYSRKGRLYSNYDLVKSIDNYNIAISLNRGEQLPDLLRSLGDVYASTGFMEKHKYYYLEAFKLDGDSLKHYNGLFYYEYFQNNFLRALEFDKKVYTMDSTKTETLFTLAAIYMILGQNKEALSFFRKWYEKSQNLSVVFILGMHRLGWAYWQNGYKDKAEYFFNEQINYCKKVNKMGRVLGFPNREFYDLAGVYAFMGDKKSAYENLEIFNESQMMSLSWFNLIKIDPLFNSIRNEPEFQQIAKDIEAKYQAEHERVRKWLETQGML